MGCKVTLPGDVGEHRHLVAVSIGEMPMASFRAEVIIVTEHRSQALARLDVFVGEWVIEARFPGDQPAPANYDSRGVARLYAMSLADGVWTLTREAPDFTPLDFRRRFTGTFSDDRNIISGAWGKGLGGTGWEQDFALTHRRAS